MMRALIVTMGALWLSACAEGVAPQAPVWNTPEVEAQQPAANEPEAQQPAANEPEALESAGVLGKRPPKPKPTPVVPPLVASSRLAFVPEGANTVGSASAVDVELTLSGVNGKGQLDVEFIAPGDMPYEKRSVTVRALPVDTTTLRFSLPVAGTLIASSAMTGEWEARFFLDGEPVASSAFTLAP
jgi:hypothetical protein